LWIAKISGVTNFDAALSVDVSSYFAIGAIIDDLNDVRSVSKFDARRIFANVEHCVTIAELVPTSIDDIFDAEDACKPNMIQINGDFFDDVNNLISVQSIATIPIIGSLFLNKETLESNIIDSDPIKAAKTLEQYVHIININLPIGQSWKKEKDQNQIVKIVKDIQKAIKKPLVIGGGLNSTNVAEIASKLKPNAIDVSSGVEKISGIKNPELMQEFLQVVYDNKDFLKGI
jgi:phosphoribosylanthranilate isomerase